MKNIDHALRAFHFAVRALLLGANPEKRIDLPLNQSARELSRPVESYIGGETQEFTDTEQFIDLFKHDRSTSEFYEQVQNPLIDLNNEYPIKNASGEVVDDIYGEKNSSSSKLYRKYIKARGTRTAKSPVRQTGNKTQSSSSDASLYIPPQLTGSLLDSVNENPDRARAAKLIFDQYAA